MRLFRHLFWADVRHFWWLIGGFLLTWAASAAVDGIWPVVASRSIRVEQFGLASALLWYGSILIMVISVPIVMHAHPFVGSDVFWMTRPIPPRTLLSSKAALLTLLVVVFPAVCEAVVMTMNGVARGEMMRVALQTAQWQAFVLAVLMMGAAVTGSLTRFVVLCVGAVLSVVVLISIMLMFATTQVDDDAGGFVVASVTSVGVGSTVEFGEAPRDIDSTPPFIALLLVIAAGGAAVAVQARTRLRRWSVATAVGGVFVAWLLAGYWPWHFLRAPLESPAWAAGDAALRLRADPDSVRFFSMAESAWREGRGKVTLAGIERGWEASVRIARATLDLPGGIQVASASVGNSGPVPLEGELRSPQHILLSGVLGVERVAVQGFPPEAIPQFNLLRLRRAELDRHIGATGQYHADALVDLSRADVAAVLTLEPGAFYQETSFRFVMDRFTIDEQTASLRARIYRASSMFDRRPDSQFTYYLRNRRRSEAVGGFEMPVHSASLPFLGVGGGGRMSGFRGIASQIRFPDWSRNTTDPVVMTGEWLADAELVIVRVTPAASISRSLEIPGFPLRAPEPLR
jgi:hypothetical protein